MLSKSFLAFAFVFLLLVAAADARTTEFTYQGKLTDGSTHPTGNYDFEFRLFETLTGGAALGTQTRVDVSVVGGVFAVRLDFGVQIAGGGRFLEIAVKPAGTGSFTTLTPRQPVTSAPSSVRSLTAGSADTTTNSALLGARRWDILAPRELTVTANPFAGASDGENIWVVHDNGAATVTKIRANDGTILGSFPTGGSRAVSAVFDGTYIWVANFNSANLKKIRASDGADFGHVSSGGSNPRGLAFDGANIWVTNETSNTVVKIRASDGVSLGSFPVGSGPQEVVFDGANVWIANLGSNSVTKLRASDGACIGACTFPAGPNPVGLTFDGSNIWIANFNTNVVTKLRASDGACVGTCSFAIGGNPFSVVFDGAYIWVANLAAPDVVKLRAIDGVIVGRFPVPNRAEYVVFDGSNVWVMNRFVQRVTKIPAF